MRTPIIQFGTSRFLQAHAALFVHEAREAGQEAGPITVVAASGGAAGKARLRGLADPAGFPVQVRGLDGGREVRREIRVRSVARALDAASDWAEVRRVFVEEARFVVSNATEAGYAVPDGLALDLAGPTTAAPPGHPARLLALLAARLRAGGGPITILPTELIARNGDELRRIVLDLARRSGAEDALVDYLARDCVFANSLVDRIVSAPIEPAGAVAEPYALWAVEDRAGLETPCRHPAIEVVEDLEPIQRLKLHILNLGHTVLAERWANLGLRADLTVREMLKDSEAAAELNAVYEGEALPGFAARGMGSRAEIYVATTLDRFANPFLDHRMSDIAVNHGEKVRKRIAAFLDWAGLDEAAAPRLSAIRARWPTPGGSV